MFLFLSGGISAPDIDTSKINIFLYTRQNPENFQIVELTEESLAASNFNPEHPIIILAHGWNSNGRENGAKGFGARFADDYLSVGEYNVFSCDWGKLEDIYYPHAAAVTEPVGQYLAGLVALLSDYGVLDNIHLVGHSLGAHVMGSAAKEVQRLGLGKLRRLTGLDPAYPFFESADLYPWRVDKSDADMVQILHTNSGFLWDGCLSFKEPIGHVDFFPAGGSHQPGCTDICLLGACLNVTINDLLKGGCSHERANLYFEESIRAVANRFLGRRCGSWEDFKAGLCCDNPTAVMGEWLDPSSPGGTYFYYVNEESPFALDEQGSC